MPLIAQRVPESERVAVLRKAMDIALSMKYYRTPTLELLVSQLAEMDFPHEALEAARAINDRATSGMSLVELDFNLTEFGRTGLLLKVLRGLIPRMSDNERRVLLQEMLTAARSITWWRRAYVLAVLVPYVIESNGLPILYEALDSGRALEDPRQRAEVLTALVIQFPEAERARVSYEALLTARTITDARNRSLALAALVDRVAEGERSSVLGEALDACRAIEIIWQRAEALVTLANHLSKSEGAPLFHEALSTIRTIEWAGTRAKQLASLIPKVPSTFLPEALEIVQETKDSHARANMLSALARYVPSSLVYKALDVAQGIRDPNERAHALIAMTACSALLPSSVLYNLWRQLLPSLASSVRPDFLSDFRSLTPIIAKLGGTTAVVETAEAIHDSAQWWP